MPVNSKKFRGACIDSPSEAHLYEAHLRDGDLVIAYVGLPVHHKFFTY